MYFANFPKIVYDFDTTVGTNYQIVTDITRNVRFRKKILENISLYDYYDMKEGETPEIVSEKIYGTPYYHWVIMLVNQRYDYITDFPISQLELDKYVLYKYGEGRSEHIHHYTENGFIKEGINTLVLTESPLDGGGIGSANVGDILQAPGVINSISIIDGGSGYTTAPTITISPPISPGITATAKAIIVDGAVANIVLLDAGSGYLSTPTVTISSSPDGSVASLLAVFTIGYVGRINEIISSVISNNSLSVTLSASLRNGKFEPGQTLSMQNEITYTIVNSCSIPQNYIAVSNYQYEFDLNESKRRIKIIDPALVEQLIKEFKDTI